MANYADLKAAIANAIKYNDNHEITGEVLQEQLLAIINAIGEAGYVFAGLAKPDTNPGSPDSNVMYIGGAGTYSNFGASVIVKNGQLVIFTYNGNWGTSVIDINSILPAYININEIANHPDAYADAATALADVPVQYRRKGVKVVYYDDDTQLWIEMLCYDDFGGNDWWTDVENNWAIEGPIETKIPTATGGQQLKIAGEKRGNLDDILNVNVWNNQATEYSSKDNARAAVPANKRKLGAIITYLLYDGWYIEQFIGSSISNWATESNWINNNNESKKEFNLIESNINDLRTNVLGESFLYKNFHLNKYVSTSAEFSDGNGWACLLNVLISDTNANIVFENENGYWQHLYIVYDANHTFLGYHFLDSSIRNNYPIINVLTAYPTAKYIDIDLWDNNTTPITKSDVAGWKLYQKDAKGGIKGILGDVENETLQNAEDISSLQNIVVGQRKLNHLINLNSLVYPNGNISDSNGWACMPEFLELTKDSQYIQFIANTKGYYFWFFILFDESKTVIGRFDAGNDNPGYKFSVPVADIRQQAPTVKYIKIDLWDGSNTVALTESDIADWNLYVENKNSLEKDISTLNDIVIGENDLSKLFILNKLIYPGGEIADANGWVCIDEFVALENNLSFKLINESGYGFWVLRCFDDNKTLIDSFEVSQVGNIKNEFTAQQVLQFVPSTKYIKIDIWDGSATTALTETDIIDWYLIVTDANSIIKKIANINNEIASIEQHLLPKKNTFHCNLTPGELSYIISPFNDTYNIKTEFYISRSRTEREKVWENVNLNFNFYRVSLVNKTTGVETVIHNCPDDIAPANYDGTYIGGNHSDSRFQRITVTGGHNKTLADIGSIWACNGKQYVLIEVLSENELVMTGENKSTYPIFNFDISELVTGNTLIHVSSATHQGNITINDSNMFQWKPAAMLQQKVFVDDIQITENGDYSFDTLKICEQYDVINPASAIDIIKQGVGTFTENPIPSDITTADKVARHSIVYEFLSADQWRVATDFIAYQNINIDYFGYTQQMALIGSSRKMYIPKALPISDGVTTFDFRTLPNYGQPASTLNLTNQYWENPLLPPDRWMQIGQHIALHSGYLFGYGVGGNKRKDSINNAFFLYTSGKIYPHGIDNKLTINAGDNYSAVMWRSYLDLANINTNGVISINVFEYGNKCYIYADFNQTGIFKINIPSKYVGLPIDVFEKSGNIESLNENANSEILVKVETANPMYAYFVASISLQ